MVVCGCGDHDWWYLLNTNAANQVAIVLACFCGRVHLLLCATPRGSSLFLLPSCLLLVVDGVVVGFVEASAGLMALAWHSTALALVCA